MRPLPRDYSERKTIVTAGREDGSSGSGREQPILWVGSRGYGPLLSPDGAVLATLGTGNQLGALGIYPAARSSSRWPSLAKCEDAAFSRDGTTLVTARRCRPPDAALGHLQPALLHEFMATPTACAPSLSRMITNRSSPPAAMQRSAPGMFHDRMQSGVHLGHTGRIWNIALSPDGRQMASAGSDGTTSCGITETEPRLYQGSHCCSRLYCLCTRRTDTARPGRRRSLVHHELGCSFRLTAKTKPHHLSRPTITRLGRPSPLMDEDSHSCIKMAT